MTRPTAARLAAACVAAVLALGLSACSSSGSPTSATSSELNPGTGNSATFAGIGLTPARPRPSFTLTDTAGKTFNFGTETAGKPTLLYFGYTNCPDVCPQTMANVSLALSKVPADVAAKVQVVFVTTDVKRDTAATIKTWLGNFDTTSKATWIGLRGTQAQIDAAQAAAHITLAEDGGATHSSQMLFFGPDNYAYVSYAESSTQEQQNKLDIPVVAAGKH